MDRKDNSITYHIGKNVKKGKDVKIWHFAYIGDNAEIGNNVSIGALAHVDYKTIIGANTRIAGLAYIPPFSVIGKDVFIGPGVVLTNDRYPPSKRLEGVNIGDRAIIGANSVIGSGCKIGNDSVVGMGSVVTKDVPTETVVMGNPAKSTYTRSDYDKKKYAWEKKLE
jgi:acetyltransferase-like isoleucine patch superfamily enzyme